MNVENYWKTIIDTLHDGLLVFDTRGRFIAANTAAEKLTGYTAAELKGKDCRILNCTGCKIIATGEKEKWCTLFSKGQVRDKKCLITHKDRRTVHLMKSGTVLRDPNGEIVGVVEILTDISQIIRQQQEIKNLRQTFHLSDGYHGIMGKSPVLHNLFELIENVSQTFAPVMIQGESGTGKELVARAIHEAGPRRDCPFIKVNCAALNDNLLESELFGHVKGAFTGADRNRIGRFEASHEGSIFLDEIGDIPISTQVKLLRVLEEKKIERVGDHKTIPVDVRIITATNKNLEALVENGTFREDLFFRINVFPLNCPSLTQRKEDIPIIVQHFIRQNSQDSGKKILGVTPKAMDALTSYLWPGNVRELRNAIDYAFVLCPGGGIGIEHLPVKITSLNDCLPVDNAPIPGHSKDRESLLQILRDVSWNQSETARKLGVSRVTVWKRMKKYNIRRPK
ncbi:MAG: sigma 54-interacting transcriptional regulator [Desulfobacteraceae bacterium]|nr:sigma 54-interacting transcriptional regulator [Desulfobacteraceae bacterium]MBC2754600.1 sigma 54-interacting transcriptional regulator [Desulfobacteraceae bacterium]